MKCDERRNQASAAVLVLSFAVLLAAGCAGEESTEHSSAKGNRVTSKELTERTLEKIERDRSRSREELTKLVAETEDLQIKIGKVLTEHGGMTDDPGSFGARLQRGKYEPEYVRRRADRSRKVLADATDEQLPMVSQQISLTHEAATTNYKRAVEKLDAAKRNQE